MSDEQVYEEKDLIYAATARCPCGAGLAYVRRTHGKMSSYWDCSAILKGEAIPMGKEGSQTHTDRLPFAFYEVKSERQPSANGSTTRPGGEEALLQADEQFNRSVKRIHEDYFKNLEVVIFDVEERFPTGHPVRQALFQARFQVGVARGMNRANKDCPQFEETP